MLSDTMFSVVYDATKEIAEYAMTDYNYVYEEGNSGPLFYDEETYQRVLESMIPAMDAQIALDCGCDLCEIKPESAYLVPGARNMLLGRLWLMVLDAMEEIAKA